MGSQVHYVAKSSSTAENVLDVLLLFDTGRRELTADEISRLIGAPRSTTYRYIRTLREKGFLERTEGDAFRLGPRLLQFARLARAQEDVGAAALPVMERLCAEARETVLLTRISNRHAVCIERVETPQAVRISFERGDVQPLHAGASSKILLAFAPGKLVEDYLAGPLAPVGLNTVTDPETLLRQLVEIRAQGYCLSESEVDEGATAVAVPVLERRGRLWVGLSTAGPTFRMGPEVIERHVALLKEAAKEIVERVED
jgi:DNA-binding IclR family transcriptional regulator